MGQCRVAFQLGLFFVQRGKQVQLLQHVVHHLVQVGAQLDRILDLLFQAQANALQFPLQQGFDALAAKGGQGLVPMNTIG